MKNDLKYKERKGEGGEDRFNSPLQQKENLAYADDLHLWRLFKNGREEALIYIYRTYVNVLYNYGCQFTKEQELVRDTVQEFFIDLIRNKHNLGDTTSIKFYLFKSFRRKLVRVLKKENKFVKEEISEERPGFNVSYNPEARYIKDQLDTEQKRLLQEKFNYLPEKQREALLLYYYEGLSYDEIASLFEMTRVKSARVLIYRAIDSLAKQLKNHKDILLLIPCIYF